MTNNLLAEGGLSEEQMLGPFFKDYAEKGHWFDSAHGKCLRCGTPTIDLFEDDIYGPIRACRARAALAGEGEG